jgi:phosphoribosylanthranilate isomerase
MKFCGITRPSDAGHAARVGARFVGAILTDSPRRVSAAKAREIYSAAGTAVGGVAVFRNETPVEIAALSAQSGATVVQIHRAVDAAELEWLRTEFEGEIWTVLEAEPRNESSARPPAEDSLGDGVLIDASVRGKSGGTGKALDWASLAPIVSHVRRGRRFILAGGLTPLNVVDAIMSLGPDVVDVSSGVESSPGIKDPAAMEEFTLAVQGASIDSSRVSAARPFPR